MSIHKLLPRDKKKDEQSDLAMSPQEQVFDILRRNAGAGAERTNDPIYALCENFAQTFDDIGRKGTQEEAEGILLHRFATYAFQNGKLAAGILQGQGMLVLQACVHRAFGRGINTTSMREDINDLSTTRRIPHSTDRIQLNHDVHSVVALTLKATQKASDVLQIILNAEVIAKENDVQSMRKIFPFLFDQEDKQLLEQLVQKRGQLQQTKQTQSPQYRAVVSGISKAQGVLAKKMQMKQTFLNKLMSMLEYTRQFQDQCTGTDSLLSSWLQEEPPENTPQEDESEQ